MRTYYNEFDPGAAAWLRELVSAGLIPAGDVDTRSITDVSPSDLIPYDICHFFAGIGGWAHALRLAEFERPGVWTGSCPCQPFSSAGKRRGVADPRHLWPEFFRLIAERRPPIVFGEQVASPDGRAWLAGVRSDLEGASYAVGAADLCAAGVGAPHIRQRLYWVADADDAGREGRRLGELQECFDERASWASGDPCRVADDQSKRRDWGAGVRGPDGRGELEAGGGLGDPRSSRSGWDTGAVSRAQSQGEGERIRARGVVDKPFDAGGDGGLEHAPGDGRIERRPKSGGRGASGRCELGGVDDSAGARLAPEGSRESDESEGRRSVSCVGREERRGLDEPSCLGREDRAPVHGGHDGQVPVDGFWSDFDLVPCRDGKLRRVEPGTFPLAHGVSGRVGLLRGYGNAIVPQVAEAFIRAYAAGK